MLDFRVTFRGAVRPCARARGKTRSRDRRLIRRLNVDGNGQGDLAGHGGEHRAVLVYQIDSYQYWERQLSRKNLRFGQFGENFTVEGLADDEVCIGDRYRIGRALFEVTQPRVTCYRVYFRYGPVTRSPSVGLPPILLNMPTFSGRTGTQTLHPVDQIKCTS